MKSFIYQTNNFGHQNNVQYYFYNRYVTQGRYWSDYSLYEIQIRNESDKVVEVVGCNIQDGRVIKLDQDFSTLLELSQQVMVPIRVSEVL